MVVTTSHGGHSLAVRTFAPIEWAASWGWAWCEVRVGGRTTVTLVQSRRMDATLVILDGATSCSSLPLKEGQAT